MYKKRKNKLIIYCCVVFGVAIHSYGQNLDIEFDHYTTNDGLSNGHIYSIIQDSKGFIWLGTGGGLNRFDGQSFISYLYETDDSTSISDNIVNKIVEDTIGNLWILTGRGLNLYNRQKDNFSRKIIKSKNEKQNDLLIISGLIDKQGFFWLSTWNAIYRFKLYNKTLLQNKVINADKYLLDENDIIPNNKNIVYSFTEDKNGIIWVASFSNKLFYFDSKQNRFIPKPIDHPESKNFSDKNKYIFADHEGDLIVAIEWKGLLVWYRKKNKFELYKPDGIFSGPNDNIFSGMIEDNNGLIWIGTRDKGGLNLFNKKTGKFQYCLSDKSNPYSLNSNKVNCVYEDKSGSIWVGVNTGLDRYSPDKNKFKRYFFNPNKPDGLNFNNVLCFAESKSGKIWIGTDGGGLNLLDRKTGIYKHYVNIPTNSNSISSNAIISLCEDHEGTLWLGTFNGGLAMMKNEKFFTYYPDPLNPNSISHRHIWKVFEDSKNNLWVGTLSGGLDLFDRKNDLFYHFTSKDGDSTSLNNNGIIGIYEDSRQNLYITTYTGVSIIELNKYNFNELPPDIKFKNLVHKGNTNSISSNVVNCANEDKNGNIWFGMLTTGLDEFNTKTGKFTNYAKKQGLPGNSVSSIQVDDHNNLWLATDKGLARMNPETHDVRVFDKQDGLQNINLRGWSLKTKDGEMFFGGYEGFNSFYPDSIKYNRHIPSVVITGLKIFNTSIRANELFNNRMILTNDISETKELTLTYKENFITFNFVSIDFNSPEKNLLKYKMENFDKDWIQCSNKLEANYTNLDPGKYTFRVKARNNDGIWNDEGTFIKLVILPPWWKTIWFKLILIAMIIIGIYSAYYIRLALYRKKQKELTVMVHQRTRELEKTNKLLLERQDQIEKQTEELRVDSAIQKETNELLQERQLLIEEQANELRTYNKNLSKTNEVLLKQQARIEEQSKELQAKSDILKAVNEQLMERQSRIEEQAEELRTHSENLKDINDLLVEKQQLIINQSEQLKTTNEELSLLNATKDRFFSIIAHDLRNPFNVVSGFSEILLKNFDKLSPEKIHKFHEMINTSSKSGNNLLENLLQWSRSQTGRISYEPAKLNLLAVAEETVRLLEGDAERKHITFQQYIDPHQIVFADENMLKTIFRNLISNAIKFTGSNGTITLKSSANQQLVEINVADSGVGIPADTISKLFRVDTIVTTKGTLKESGTGLGLLLCKDFVEKHNGKIWVESVVGKGSEFKFSIPLA